MRFFLLSLICVCHITMFAQNKPYRHELGFRSDNDVYLASKQDRYYTNGLFIHYRQAAKAKDSAVKKIWGISAGQEMYNARSGNIKNIVNVDRPFASYLYAGASMQWLKSNENSVKTELQIGTIGPAAMGEEAQKLLHQVVGFYEVSGWQYQVNNELGINAKLGLHYLLLKNRQRTFDFSLPLLAELGNTYSGLSAGLLFRTGNINPLNHSVATQSTVSSTSEKEKNKELYFYLQPNLKYVAYNATIQGGMFRTDKGPVTYNPKPFVFSQEIGAAFASEKWTVDFSIIFKSKELESVKRSEQYGSISLYYRF